MTLMLVVATLVGVVGMPRLPSRVAEPGNDDIILLAELVGLGMSAGANLPHALAWAGSRGHPALAAEVAGVLRRSRLGGLAEELRGAPGHLEELFGRMARAVETGAALGPTIDGYITELTALARAEYEIRLQRLPIKLLFPLALLMLPGLMLMLAGPAFIDVFSRFAGSP